MAIPQLVFCPAGDSFKQFPGEFVAVAAADHLGAARGSLTTEADALSAGGTVVRDTQAVNNILSSSNTAYQAADDTLAIAGLPITDNKDYHVYVTHRIEGYTDVTDGALLRTHFNENWLNAMVYGAHTSSESSNIRAAATPPPLPYYRASYLGFKRWFTGDTWFMRFAAESGSTIEILIDQIFIFRDPVDSSLFPRAGNTTFETVAATQDGADGGDANSKFTWFARNPIDVWSSRGDYQRKADGDDAEYFSEVTTDDGLSFWNSGDEQGPSAWMYSLHTANYRGVRTWMDDTFDNRDTSSTGTYPSGSYGISPDGFGASQGGSVGPAASRTYVNGAGSMFMELNGFLNILQLDLGSGTVGTTDIDNQGMKFQLYDQWSWAMVFQWTQGTPGLHIDPLLGNLQVSALYPNPVASPGVYLNLGSPSQWQAINPGISGLGTAHDVSGWLGLGSYVGIRMEQKRHWFRMRVWDASGAEPSTWDEEFFLYDGQHGDAYPYSDIEDRSARMMAAASPDLQIRVEITDNDYNAFTVDGPLELRFDTMQVTHDPYGDPESMFARVERPPGTSLGDIEIPFGSSYWVYWGKRDWTDTAFGNDYLEFSTRVWNDPAAAEIQRAEVGDYYFYWFFVVPFNLVSMNWRSGDRSASHYRILRGNK